MTREPLSTGKTFTDNISQLQAEIETLQSKLRAPGQRIDMLYATLYEKELRLIYNHYSAGMALDEIRPLVAEATAHFIAAVTHPKADNPALRLTFYIYYDCISLLSWNIFFGTEKGAIEALAEAFDLLGRDLLLDTMLAPYLPGRKISPKLLWPKAYEALMPVFSATVAERPDLMKAYLQNWYKGMKKANWHDAHKKPDGYPFFGYWSFEAAAVTTLLLMDDSTYRDMVFYPKDAATFALEQAAKTADA